MATALGVAGRTYANYERDDRLPDADALSRLVAEGWNANWLLTGEGPERLADLGGSDASQPVSQETLRIAIQQVEEVVASHQLPMPPAKKAELILAVAELIQDGMPEAKVLRFVRAAAA